MSSLATSDSLFTTTGSSSLSSFRRRTEFFWHAHSTVVSAERSASPWLFPPETACRFVFFLPRDPRASHRARHAVEASHHDSKQSSRPPSIVTCFQPEDDSPLYSGSDMSSTLPLSTDDGCSPGRHSRVLRTYVLSTHSSAAYDVLPSEIVCVNFSLAGCD